MTHLHALDSYLPGNSPVHRLDPRVKLGLTLLFILTVALTPDRKWAVFGLLEGMILLTIFSARVGMGVIQKRSALAIPFVLAALTVVFVPGALDTARIPIPGTPWAISTTGLWRFVSIAVRSYLSVQAAVLLAATTPFPDLLWGMRALKVPPLLVAIGGFLYRYLFVLADEAQRMMQARETRSAALPGRKGGGTLSWRARVTGVMAGTLFLRSYERSERIWSAMVTRGYDGEVRMLSVPALGPADLRIGAFLAGAFLVLITVGHI